MSKKKIITVICILLVAVTVFVGAGKVSRESESFAEGFLQKYYTINDYDTYSYIRSNPQANEFTAERLAKEKYELYFTDEGMAQFVKDGRYEIMEQLSSSNKCTVSLESTQLEKVLDDRDKHLIAYDYEAKVVVTSADGQTYKATQHGRITMDTKDELKISLFQVIDSSSMLNAVSSLY